MEHIGHAVDEDPAGGPIGGSARSAARRRAPPRTEMRTGRPDQRRCRTPGRDAGRSPTDVAPPPSRRNSDRTRRRCACTRSWSSTSRRSTRCQCVRSSCPPRDQGILRRCVLQVTRFGHGCTGILSRHTALQRRTSLSLRWYGRVTAFAKWSLPKAWRPRHPQMTCLPRAMTRRLRPA